MIPDPSAHRTEHDQLIGHLHAKGRTTGRIRGRLFGASEVAKVKLKVKGVANAYGLLRDACFAGGSQLEGTLHGV